MINVVTTVLINGGIFILGGLNASDISESILLSHFLFPLRHNDRYYLLSTGFAWSCSFASALISEHQGPLPFLLSNVGVFFSF
jgi:hypothetical protein